MRFAVNYLAGFLPTRLLLPLMMVSAPARIVNVSSLAQQPIDFDDVMLTRGYTGGRAYAQNKLAQIMFTFDLARELDLRAITANSVHPATYMATTMVRQSGVTPVSSVEEGAEAILNLAMSKELEVISRSAFDLQAVFETVAESSVRLCGADRSFIFRFDGELLRMAVAYNAPQELKDFVSQNPALLVSIAPMFRPRNDPC